MPNDPSRQTSRNRSMYWRDMTSWTQWTWIWHPRIDPNKKFARQFSHWTLVHKCTKGNMLPQQLLIARPTPEDLDMITNQECEHDGQPNVVTPTNPWVRHDQLKTWHDQQLMIPTWFTNCDDTLTIGNQNCDGGGTMKMCATTTKKRVDFHVRMENQ